MARRSKAMNEVVTLLSCSTAAANTDRDIRILVPGDACKLKHWKIAKGLAGTGTAIITLGAFSAAAGAGTRIMADVSIDIDAAAGTITAGADATGDFTFADGDALFLFCNYDAGTATVPGEFVVTLVWQM